MNPQHSSPGGGVLLLFPGGTVPPVWYLREFNHLLIIIDCIDLRSGFAVTSIDLGNLYLLKMFNFNYGAIIQWMQIYPVFSQCPEPNRQLNRLMLLDWHVQSNLWLQAIYACRQISLVHLATLLPCFWLLHILVHWLVATTLANVHIQKISLLGFSYYFLSNR